ncbi:glutamate racemase [Paenibacillus physcomitrellae]|uniref:Glutamate racemase n=1 Tax=Paenibacillus physcomitrellae TaxID=1619311 RepID=A0ABQ1GJJ4_9BACL|nr:glutamate racemase [Paenibacillus physcomitrellae]GGA45113.1 glutamate racemase 2 [Paenibacillus physcomitrellae]
MRIAFFDSGIGGLTVLNEAIRKLPDEDFLYFADTLHVPYGTKSLAEVNQYVKESVQAIMQEEIKALVVACNTATSAAISELRGMYSIPIIGMEPAVKPAVEISLEEGRRVLVFATPLTLSQAKYTDLVARVDDHSIVDSFPLPELVPYCESLNFDPVEIGQYFRTKLAPLDLSQYGTVVLGCTHYPFYRDILREVLPAHIELIDGSKGTVKRLTTMLSERHLLGTQGTSSIKLMCSGPNPEYIAKMEKALAYLQQGSPAK